MILSESINLKLQNQNINSNTISSTLKSKIASAVFMSTGLASGTGAVIVLLNKLNII